MELKRSGKQNKKKQQKKKKKNRKKVKNKEEELQRSGERIYYTNKSYFLKTYFCYTR